MPSHALAIFCILSLPVAAYDSEKKVEHARLYGDVDSLAYYFVDLVVGTPPQRVSVILDTGSGICAFPCAGCNHCGHHIDPIFDIEKSGTASWLKCAFNRCPVGRCMSEKCYYYQGYTEGSSITGYWFEDMVSLGDMIQHNPQVKARMGCHSDENNLFYTQKANGMMGVGPGGLEHEAVLEQLLQDKAHVSRKIFSICLAEWGGQFNVGGYNDSYHTGPMQLIPMMLRGFYGVGLTKMEVSDMSITDWHQSMIDSGTTYTYMNSRNYRLLASGVEKACSGQSQPCGGKTHGSRCWKLPNGPSKFPAITVSFGSVKTKWVPEAYLYRKGDSDTYCYAFQDDGPTANTVLGAVWMKHQEIMFDLDNKQVGIAPARCPEHRERPAHLQDNQTSAVAAATSTVTSTSTAEYQTSTQATTPEEYGRGQSVAIIVSSIACLIVVLFVFKKVCFDQRRRRVELKDTEMMAVDNTARLMPADTEQWIPLGLLRGTQTLLSEMQAVIPPCPELLNTTATCQCADGEDGADGAV
eukprot:s679_g29.t2